MLHAVADPGNNPESVSACKDTRGLNAGPNAAAAAFYPRQRRAAVMCSCAMSGGDGAMQCSATWNGKPTRSIATSSAQPVPSLPQTAAPRCGSRNTARWLHHRRRSTLLLFQSACRESATTWRAATLAARAGGGLGSGAAGCRPQHHQLDDCRVGSSIHGPVGHVGAQSGAVVRRVRGR
jgi:hypothetical protein